MPIAGKLAGGRLLIDCPDALVERVDAPVGRFSLAESMIVERGDRSDWDLLCDLHYKGHTLPPGARFWKLTLNGETIGVTVTGVPKGLLKERHVLFPKLKPGVDSKISNTARYKFVNANFRVISRFVIDTMYRGIGAGYRMMNLVSRLEGPKFMEIQSSMSKFNQFGPKAGFKYVKPMNAVKFEEGIAFFRQNFVSSPQDFEAIVAEIEAMSEAKRRSTLERCRLFYWRNSPNEQTGARRGEIGHDRVQNMSVRDLIRNMQQLIMASPLYGIYANPDFGREMPKSLPLLAFDHQPVNEPLRL